MRRGRLLPLVALALLGADAGEEPAEGFDRTPPRLALVAGEVSFQRLGSDDWALARPNLALAAGDRLYAREGARLEVQIGPGDFLRAGERTELALVSDDGEILQLRVGAGLVSLDVRSPGRSALLDTPNAAFAAEEPGSYRLEVASDSTTLTCRRGRATLTTPGGRTLVVGANEQVVVTGLAAPEIETAATPALDDWDAWIDERTHLTLDAFSARYVSADVYGAGDLDAHGSWHTVAPYGPIWVPAGVPVGWGPYSLGRWLWDPHFGWTWLDDAPWGWAPFHYGRWIHLHGVWAWVPGPLRARAYYAPALVAFYGGPHRVVWVPLGWGEPCRPWWGPRRFVGQPHWLGWSGPRVVSEAHANASLAGGAIAIPGTSFGREPVAAARLRGVDTTGLRLVRGAVLVKRTPAGSLGAFERIGAPPRAVLGTGAPPRASRDRPVFSTRGRLDVRERALPHPALGGAGGLERRIREASGIAPVPGIALPGRPANPSQRGSSVPGAVPRWSGPAHAPGLR